jgi:hypothetical protein
MASRCASSTWIEGQVETGKLRFRLIFAALCRGGDLERYWMHRSRECDDRNRDGRRKNGGCAAFQASERFCIDT